MMEESKYYVVSDGKQEQAERKIFAQMIRKVIGMRGRSTALRFLPPPADFVSVPVSTLADDDIRPENGYYLFGAKPPVYGELQKDKGLVSSSLSFREMADGRYAAPIRVKWTATTKIHKTVVPIQTAIGMGAVQINDDYTVFSDFQFDVTDVIDKYAWDEILDSAPAWKEEE
jgi:hypothetical protein